MEKKWIKKNASLNFVNDVGEFIKIMKISTLLMFLCFTTVTAKTYSQQKLSMNYKNIQVIKVLHKISQKTDFEFLYNDEVLNNLKPVSLNLKDATVYEVLDLCLKDQGITYKIDNKVILLTLSSEKLQQEKLIITGKVVGEDGESLPGVTVLIRGTNIGVATNSDGNYKISIPREKDIVLVFSFIGMKSEEIKIGENKIVNVILKESIESIKEVVITGIYTRKKESFTGSASTFTAKELKSVGGTNILQSLRSLDPAFSIIESNEFGSDPNRLPDIEIRGKSSLLGVRDNIASDPNQPLFILDGFETTLEAIFNIDMNRVSSITILKDAASTAIYGSKAANGVVVVETIKPQDGELRVSYNGNLNISMPDLSSYNMMNAKEKLKFEELAGRFKGTYVEKDIQLKKRYNQLKQNVDRGVNTYWLAEPLRIGINHRHSIYLTGGSKNFMFNIGGSYNGIAGIMKQSKREILAGNIDIIYRVKKFQFSNKFEVDNTTSSNPKVQFNEFVRANPFYAKTDEDGIVNKWLDYDKELSIFSPNPLYNNNLNSYNDNNSTNYSEKFVAEYMPIPELKIRTRLGLSRNIKKVVRFISPNHTMFQEQELLERGTYSSNVYDKNKYEGEFTVTYGKNIAEKHQLNFVCGGNIYSLKTIDEGYSVKGFPTGNFKFPSFSKGYPEGGVPTYNDSKMRSVSSFANLGYSYKYKYLLDLSYRINGSSVFGSSRRYAKTWSIGVAWNINNENFIKNNTNIFDMLKIRASIGNPGNQNFESYMSNSTYKYSFNNFNYFGMSTVLDKIGNPNLKWQTTKDINVGFDITILDNRFTINLDCFYKYTDPLLISINIPSSSGTKLENTNMGNQVTKGINISTLYYIIYKPLNRTTWNIRANLRHYTSKYDGFGNKLNALNKYGEQNNSLSRYYDGADPDDLWAVRSLGIDPASGRELLLKKDNTKTYDYLFKDEVIVGNTRPKVEGIIGSGFKFKGLSVDVTLRYKLGADIFNYSVFNKVENITASSYNYNLDRRAFSDRWKEVGDFAKYKDIKNATNSKVSSRFVERENILSIESIRLGYEFSNKLVSNLGLSSVKINAYIGEIARFSSVKTERGTLYPFSRSIQFDLSLNF